MIRAVIFDMGGVIVDLGPISDIVGGEESSAEQLWEQWLGSTAVRDFEMGRCPVEEFGARLVRELDLSVPGAEVVERFRTWPRGLYPGAADLIASLNGDLEVGLLSNTNSLHWYNQIDNAAIRSLFRHTYLSFELGMAKPDAPIFEHVISDLNLPPEAVLFLDDNQINVDGARAVGMQADLVKGTVGARAALERRAIVPGS